MTEPADLREWFAGRELPTVVVPLPTDATAYASAEDAVAVAAQRLLDERAAGSADVEAEKHALAQARAALAAQPVRGILLRALPGREWETLVAAHPPDEDAAAKGYRWNVTTFRPALVAESMVPGEGMGKFTAAEVEQLLDTGKLTIGELYRLYDDAVTLNSRSPLVSVGKA